jgi:hypothetical protein
MYVSLHRQMHIPVQTKYNFLDIKMKACAVFFKENMVY